MLKKLFVKNFKCFDELEIPFSNLNLLVGTNSSGKSSVIQALLVLIQNSSYQGKSLLNGKLISLGTFEEVANYITNAKEFILRASEENQSIELVINQQIGSFSIVQEPDKSYLFDLKNGKFKYIPANRIGYENLYFKSYDETEQLGSNAQFVFDFFEKNKDKPIHSALLVNTIQTLDYNVNFWLKKILKTYIKTNSIEKTDNVRAEYSYNSDNYYVRPKNIGSGISYMVSVLISCLLARPEDLIIIENPEIHLHPKAQSILSEFFVLVAKAGIQLIIETHSDHIFNGLRKAVNKYSKDPSLPSAIDKDLLKIHFFVMDNEQLQSKHTEIILNDLGGIINYQKLLFDQFDDDLDELLDL